MAPCQSDRVAEPILKKILQEISKDFDRNYNDLVSSFKEQLQAQYPYDVIAAINDVGY